MPLTRTTISPSGGDGGNGLSGAMRHAAPSGGRVAGGASFFWVTRSVACVSHRLLFDYYHPIMASVGSKSLVGGNRQPTGPWNV